MNLVNQKILIVGASSGLGKATAIQLSQQGAKMVLISRSEEKLQEVISQCSGECRIRPEDAWSR